jgi:hypothetical protein
VRRGGSRGSESRIGVLGLLLWGWVGEEEVRVWEPEDRVWEGGVLVNA